MLVNNVGTSYFGEHDQITIDDINRLININIISHLTLSKEIIRLNQIN